VVDLEHLGPADAAEFLDEAEKRRRRRQNVDRKPDRGSDARQVQQTVAVYVDHSLDRRYLRHDIKYFGHVDDGGPQQLLPDGAAELGKMRIDRGAGLLEK